MAHVHLTKFRQNISEHFDMVTSSRAPLLVTRQGKESLIMMAEGEYESLMETLHLISSRNNADRLMESIKQLDEGKLITEDPTL
ncbi:type II toxin-antitoxin system Phd/YefM family antitoxin [Pantoea ananatis]|uniref:type II toxin-antitoxin system Phd/YefM family antitoxin n=1 Tax=Pantoea ananas TaxID=553 RepID=UPI001B301480|nr:type II toxin-antitoxin system Phd/YefM family antitoxin [Pantoea ananatis]